MALDVAHRRRNLRRWQRGCIRLQQAGFVALHELNQQQLEQPRDNLGARRCWLQALAEHLLHIAAHTAAAARMEMHVAAVVGFIIEGVEQEPRDRACGRKALLQAAAEHWPRNDDAQHNVVLAELTYGMRAGDIEQEHLVLGERERCAVDDLRSATAIDIADFDIIVHVFRHRIEARIAHDRQAFGHTLLAQGERWVADFTDMSAINICLITLAERIAPVVMGARAIGALAVGQLEQKVVQPCDIHYITIVDSVIFCRGFDISRTTRSAYSDFNGFERLVLEEWVWRRILSRCLAAPTTTMCFRFCGSRARRARRSPSIWSRLPARISAKSASSRARIPISVTTAGGPTCGLLSTSASV